MPSSWVEEQHACPKLSMQEVMTETTFRDIQARLQSSAGAHASPGDDASPAATTKLYQEKLYAEWLKLVCNEVRWEIKYNCGVKTVQEQVQSYFVAKEYRPDLWYALVANGWLFPLTYMEVLSNGDLDVTVGESERTLLDQLRLYRMFDTSCTKVHGYVVPASVTVSDVPQDIPAKSRKIIMKKNREQEKRRCPLLQVTVEWEESGYMFSSNLELIHGIDALLKSVRANVTNNERLVRSFSVRPQYPFFLPVSPDQMVKDFGSGAFQLSSGKSIVIASGNKVYKLVISASVDIRLREQHHLFLSRTAGRTDVDHFISIPDPAQLLYGKFYVSERLIFPLLKGEALTCIQDFILLACRSISALHECNYCHLDIRLENICFKVINTELKAILIDPECLCASDKRARHLSSTSAMGIMPVQDLEPDVKALDWKQFGIVIACIMQPIQV